MKFLFSLVFLFFLNSTLRAEEGMWIPSLLKKLNESDMQTMGMKLCAEDIYAINKASIKDAIVSMNGGGCTAEVISDQGLMLTNHHCGYSDIQSLSSIQNDYLKNGFWAMSRNEELPTSSKASFIVMIEDVTTQVMKDVIGPLTNENLARMKKNAQDIIAKITEGTHYEATIKPFNYGNSYFLIVQETYLDVRMVFAPPSSIGKFGGDTDNWMWPRHTGDFCIYRIYAGKDNKPAAYSKDNVPYKPAHSLPISISGVKEDDFTMVFGFPGTTREFLTSYAVENIMKYTNPARIKMREASLEIIDAAMRSSDTIRIQYAAKQARISNAYKKWIGESNGLKRLNAIEKKKSGEAEFTKRVYQNQNYIEKYGKTLDNLKSLNEKIKDYSLGADYFNELVYYGAEFIRYARNFEKLVDEYDNLSKDKAKLEEEIKKLQSGASRFFKNYNAKTDRKIFEKLFDYYIKGTPSTLLPDYIQVINSKYKNNYQLLANDLYTKSFFTDSTRVKKMLSSFSSSSIKKIKEDPAFKLMQGLFKAYNEKIYPELSVLNAEIDLEMQTYVAGMMEMIPEKKYWFDANSTLRISYGKVEGSTPKDGMEYNYFTTLDGLMDKYIPGDVEFDVPEKLRQLYYKKDYGRYAENGKIHVAFTASNQTTGGNSGSPVLNAYGELIGVNFDRTWESTMSDVMYDPTQCRNIILDIRYVLFVVDKMAGAGYLLDEMNIIDDEKRKVLAQQKLQNEFTALTDSIQLNPENTKLLMRRGKKYNENKMYESAIRDFEAAYKLDSKSDEIAISLAESMLKNKKFKEVAPVIDKLMSKEKTPALAFKLRSELKLENGKFTEALADAKKYTEKSPNDPEGILLRAKINMLMNKNSDACTDLRQYENMTGTSQEILRKQICGE